jgi:hypothetical protein
MLFMGAANISLNTVEPLRQGGLKQILSLAFNLYGLESIDYLPIRSMAIKDLIQVQSLPIARL